MEMSGRDSKHLSLKELKGNIREALQKSGALNTVKAQIRREFVEGFKDSTPQSKRRKDHKLWDRILLSVIYHHFKHLKLNHSLSVFVAESGFDSSALIDAIDIPMSLNFGTESKIYRALQKEINQVVEGFEDEEENRLYVNKVTQSSKSVLELLVNESCASSRKHSIETSCQTDLAGPGVRETLDQQVKELHLSYTTRRETERLLPNKTIEERMISFQRECEDRFRKEYESQLHQVKTVEISRIRAEEANKKRIEIDLARKELEGSYQHRLQAHLDREAESVRVAADKARQASMLEYESRQRMQRELDDLRIREENSRRKIDLETQGIRMLEARLKESQVSIESREREISRKEKELIIKTNETLSQVRDEASRASERELDGFLRDKATLMLERKRFEEERESDTSRQMALAEMRNKFREMQDLIDRKDDEVAQLNSALTRMKYAMTSENSSAAKLLEEYGISDEEISTNNANNKLDSMVLLIKKNAELETRSNQVAIQLASTQADLDREHHKKSDLNENLLVCKQELQLSSDANLEKDKTISKLLEDNEKLKRMLTNVRRARLALSEESKELEQLVGEQRTMIIQMRKTSSRDAVLLNSVQHSAGAGAGRVGSKERRNIPFEKENTHNHNFEFKQDVQSSARDHQYVSKYNVNSPNTYTNINTTAPPSQLGAEDTKYRQDAIDRQKRLDDELAAMKAREAEEASRQQSARERQRELDYELEVIKRREIEDMRQRQTALEKQRQLDAEQEAVQLRDIEHAKRSREDDLIKQRLLDAERESARLRDVEAAARRKQEDEDRQKRMESDAVRQHQLDSERESARAQSIEDTQRNKDNAAYQTTANKDEDDQDKQRQILSDNAERESARLRDVEAATILKRKQEEEERERQKVADDAREEERQQERARDLAAKEAKEAIEAKAREDRLEAQKKKEQQEKEEKEEEESRRVQALAVAAAAKEEEDKKKRLADEEIAAQKAREDESNKEIEEKKRREQEEIQRQVAAEQEKKDLEEKKKKEDADHIQTARARVLARRQQQKMRQEVEEPPPVTMQNNYNNKNGVQKDEPLERSGDDSPNNTLSDTDIRSFDGDDSSDYDWS